MSLSSKEIDVDAKDKLLKQLLKPHVGSFNEFIENGLSRAIKNIPATELKLEDDTLIKVFFEEAEIAMPRHPGTECPLYPRDCRIKAMSYTSSLLVRFGWSINDEYQHSIPRELTKIPIMVKSNRCSINRLTQKQLIKFGEEANEQGGYFLSNGIERMIRMLIVQRRNYPLAISRPSWKTKVSGLTEFGVSVRSVDNNNNIVSNVLHYCSNSTMVLSISYDNRQYFVPYFLVLRVLVNFSDLKIFSHFISNNNTNDTFWKDSAKCMLSAVHLLKIKNCNEAKEYMGETFRVKLGLPAWYSDSQIGEFLIKNCICIHLKSNLDKFNFLIGMAHKLMALVDNVITVESSDTLNNQELLLPGQIYQIVLMDKLKSWLKNLQFRILSVINSDKTKRPINSSHIISAITKGADIGAQMEYFMKSGNIKSKNGLGLPQMTGFCIVADKINYIRFLSHFRSIHRGSYFTHSYSTKVRKLLPECWGFLCPVHTPDGTPCGLLNHLSQSCDVVTENLDIRSYETIITSSGLVFNIPEINNSSGIQIVINGRIIGFVSTEKAKFLVEKLVTHKVESGDCVEIVYMPKEDDGCLFPGIFIFSTASRLVRPVKNLYFNKTEWIGTFEQIFYDISLNEKDIKPDVTSHVEVNSCNILSIAAALTPFSDCNQSPRNMYQCQMMKQSMAFSMYSFRYRFDNKTYRLITPQSPICRNTTYQNISLDDYPIGWNSVLAVISYTGYDMEDAMIINKSSIERGFANACIYKSILVDLMAEAGSNHRDRNLVFGCKKTDKCYYEKKLDMDGLPFIGSVLFQNDPFYSYYDVNNDEHVMKLFKLAEIAYVDDIAIVEINERGIIKVNIRLRIPRNPLVGDKFSSRHGQKNILSILWALENMPFTESGIIPDMIFNPHGFPSRMTIGMMIENMAGKVGALEGKFFNSDPFQPNAETLVECFGDMLRTAGYHYFGSEKMYSGTNGEELEVNIFTGIVYYQRLRHMVSDKFQVRNVGPVEPLTRQPVPGRKRGGGIRFGEMERDGLISHGCSYLLQDRLFECSDKSLTFVCGDCGDVLATKLDPKRSFNPLVDFKPPSVVKNKNPLQFVCLLCNSNANIKPVYIPYSFRYLLVELASMNIRVKLKF